MARCDIAVIQWHTLELETNSEEKERCGKSHGSFGLFCMKIWASESVLLKPSLQFQGGNAQLWLKMYLVLYIYTEREKEKKKHHMDMLPQWETSRESLNYTKNE